MMKFYRFSLLIVLWLTIGPQITLGQDTDKILIIPFDVRSDTKYAFLKPAVADMLFTRLSAPGRTLVMETPARSSGTAADPAAIADAIHIARQKGADFVVSGSITLLDGTIGMDALFIGVAEQKALIKYRQKGERPGDIITQIDNFSAKINADVFSPVGSVETIAPQSDAPEDVYQHPEKITIPEAPSEKPAGHKPTHGKKPRPSLQPVDNR